ncbi:MAG: secretin N-terminal domain-containing protein [Arcobacter sp.]|jgi:general secretion pathway protein D|uniref:secretin N-terminal domain-containing protein n=1 Tax=Arcobacter sp. TaxID=1872629 RepID=UPI002A747D32|nr:secretin N-terminal domain-containing protein [Arcobacter sp.]MDY3204494.1 secretin N-terminal domain-containing protein [Arcobacter sp.]
MKFVCNLLFLWLFVLELNVLSSEKININFKDLKIMELIKITSKIINKNILINEEIEGNVDFISNKPVNEEELIKILEFVLEDKGFSLVQESGILRVVMLDNFITKDSVIVELKNIDVNEAKKNLEEIAKSKFNEKLENEKISIVENKENNTLVIIGEKENISYLANYIKNVDNDTSLIKTEIKIFSLKNIEATNVIKILDTVIGKKTYTEQNKKPLLSFDEETNSIIVMGLPDELEYINKLIDELDKEKTQVYVQARIIEVNDELVNNIGVQYGIFGGSAGSNGLATFSSNLNGGSTSINDVLNVIDLNIPDIKSGLALGASLNLLKQNGALDIVSEPSILAVNNKESSIYVGEKISVQTSSSLTDGGTQRTNYQREDVGLTLKVKPRISSESKVTLEINTLLEGVKTTQTSSGNPDTLKKEIKTTAILNNGESVIIGGLIENKNESKIQKVPVLGEIPIFGNLFTNDFSTTKKNNLVVIVTPYMIPKAKDITYVRNQLAQLKGMEDRYLEDSLIRLKEDAIKKKIETQKREKRIEELNEQLKDLSNENKIVIDKSEHEKRVKEILGQ